MHFGTIRALDSLLSSNKHLTFSSWFRTWSSDFKCFLKHQFITAYLLFCPKRGQRMERCLFFFSQPPERSNPDRLGRCRELSRKWLVCDTKVRGVTCISVGRYNWPAGDLSSKKTFKFVLRITSLLCISCLWLFVYQCSVHFLFCGLWFHDEAPLFLLLNFFLNE